MSWVSRRRITGLVLPFTMRAPWVMEASGFSGLPGDNWATSIYSSESLFLADLRRFFTSWSPVGDATLRNRGLGAARSGRAAGGGKVPACRAGKPRSPACDHDSLMDGPARYGPAYQTRDRSVSAAQRPRSVRPRAPVRCRCRRSSPNRYRRCTRVDPRCGRRTSKALRRGARGPRGFFVHRGSCV